MIPQTMQDATRWVCWRDDDGRKTPVNATTGFNAKSNDPSTWTTYQHAKDRLTTDKSLTGPGFMLGDGFAGIDLDGCIDAKGAIQPWAWEIILALKTYSEISPSGTGVKLFLVADVDRGRKTQINVEPCCDKKPGIEVYGGGRYFTVTGDELAIGGDFGCEAKQQQLDELIAKHWPEPVRQPTTLTVSRPVEGQADAVERARRYLAQMPGAVSGCSGHNATFRAACVLMLGFDLRVEDAFGVIQEWNQKCEPPWEDRDLWKKVSDADKRDGERGWLLNSGGRYEGPDVDLRNLMASFNGPDECEPASLPSMPEIDPGRMPDSILNPPGGGLMGEFIDYVLGTSRYPQPEIALAAAISLMSVITGRKVSDHRNTRTNIYTVACAPTGSGKDWSRKMLKKVLRSAGPEAQKFIGAERIASSTGLVNELRDKSPSRLFMLDECHRLLVTMKDGRTPHLFNIGSVLLTWWSSSNEIWTGDAYADSDKTPEIDCPHCVIFGSATPQGLWDSLDIKSMYDGLIARFCIFEGEYVMPVDAPCPQVPSSLTDQIRWWAEFGPGDGNLVSINPSPPEIGPTTEAAKRLFEHATSIDCRKLDGEHPMRSAIWSRCAEKAAKFALMSACSRALARVPNSIDISDANWGVALANFLTRRLISRADSHVSENETERSYKRVLDAIRQAGGSMTFSELSRACRWLPARSRNDLLQDLVQSGDISLASSITAGRPVNIVSLTERAFSSSE